MYSSRPVLGGNSGTWGDNEAPKGRKSRPKAEAGVGFLGRGRPKSNFGTYFSLKNVTPGGNNFNFFSGNQHNNLQILDAMTDKDIIQSS